MLVAADALGTNPFFTIGDDRVGVHPFLKLTPPRRLRAYEPQHLLVGHGEGVHGPEATVALTPGALPLAALGRQVGCVAPVSDAKEPVRSA